MPNRETRWPHGYSATVSVTLDNMGEAAEIHRGTWPDDRAPGEHFSVTQSLPRILDLLDEYRIKATYFIEGWNAGVYPDAIREVRRRGHEVGFHGWQHENWASHGRRDEARSIARNRDSFASIDIDLRGFRPPGGLMTESTLELLRESGFSYTSPAGKSAAIVDEMVILPFEWRGIDAYHYSAAFEPLREIYGDPSDPRSPGEFVDAVTRIFDQRRESSGYTAILFHPFLENDPERVEAMRAILESIAASEDLWCAPCIDVARWVIDHPDQFPDDPELELTSWRRS